MDAEAVGVPVALVRREPDPVAVRATLALLDGKTLRLAVGVALPDPVPLGTAAPIAEAPRRSR